MVCKDGCRCCSSGAEIPVRMLLVVLERCLESLLETVKMGSGLQG